MNARDLACRCFWTERPLVQLYYAAHGPGPFGVKQLIAFAESLPASVIEKLWAGDSQSPALPIAHKETNPRSDRPRTTVSRQPLRSPA